MKNNVISKFYENKHEKFSKFSHNWQVLAGLVELYWRGPAPAQ